MKKRSLQFFIPTEIYHFALALTLGIQFVYDLAPLFAFAVCPQSIVHSSGRLVAQKPVQLSASLCSCSINENSSRRSKIHIARAHL